jgi:putative transcriptional regulator
MNPHLKAARLAKGYTQEQMAELLGYKSKSGYCNIERGLHNPPLPVAIKIAKVLETPVEVLFRNTVEDHVS